MDLERDNKEIIFDAYMKYKKCCGKKGSKMNPGRMIAYRAETAAQAERCCYYWENSSLLETERKEIADKSRRLYKQYCMQCRYQPEVRDEKTDKRLDRLMGFVAEYEAGIIASLEERSTEKIWYDVEAMAAEDRYIRCLVNHSMREVIAQYAQEHGGRAEYVDSDPEHTYFVTKTGTKYHRKECRYCTGKILSPVSLSEIRAQKRMPCRCIDMKEVKSGPVMTVFIDETIRPNRLHEWNQKIPAKTAMFSYILCRGCLNSEKQITNTNRLENGVGLVTGAESKGVERVAMEAMNQVLLKIAGKFDFFGEVIIYTDNLSAKNLWPRKLLSKKISAMFQKVTVYHIERKANTAADRVGRRRSIVELPAETLDRLVQELEEGKTLKSYQKSMHKYFPNGVINVENLIEELEDLLEEITVLKAADRTEGSFLGNCGSGEQRIKGEEDVCDS